MSSALPVDAQLKSKGGYSSGAYSELGADDTYLERVSDWLATAGRSEEEKAVIKSRRRAARKINKIQKATVQKMRAIEKQKREVMRDKNKRK